MAVGDRVDTDIAPHTMGVGTIATHITVIAAVGVVVTMIADMTMAVTMAVTMAATGVGIQDHAVTGKTITCTATNRSAPGSTIPETDRHALQIGTLVIAGGSTIPLRTTRL